MNNNLPAPRRLLTELPQAELVEMVARIREYAETDEDADHPARLLASPILRCIARHLAAEPAATP